MDISIGYVVASVIQLMVFTVYINEIFGLKRKGVWLPLCWIIAELLYVFLNNLENAIINSLSYIAILFLLTLLVSKGKIVKKLIMSVVYAVFCILLELVFVGCIMLTGVLTIEEIQSNEFVAVVLLLAEQAIMFCIIHILFSVFKERKNEESNLIHCIGIIINELACMVAILVVAYNMVKVKDFSGSQMIVLIVLISVNFISYYFYNLSVENSVVKNEKELYRKQAELYNEWHESVKNAREEVRSIRHDMNNHLSAIKGIAQNDRRNEDGFTEIVNYIDSLNLKKDVDYITDSGNVLIDAMIDMKRGYAKSQNVDFEAELLVPRNMRFNEPDFVIVFGNLIDNAIEACTRNGGNVINKICTKIKFDRGNIFIFVKNTYDGSLEGQSGNIEENLHIETSKRDKDNHGMGLKNVARVVEKYDGEVKWKTKDKHFIVNVLMYGFIEM